MSGLRIPVATYRLQFHGQFRFEDARTLVPYLSRLGISDLYASPILQALSGSLHGYDVTDPSRLNPELGTAAEFNALTLTLEENEMGLLLDIVPNHMVMSTENPWWWDVLEKKQNSPFAAFFDTDWLNFGGVTGKSTGHRRFFDIGDLIGIRVEEEEVFQATHALVLRLVREGKVTGLRIDHIDGLYDPQQYLFRLQQHMMPEGEEARGLPDFYVVVEKILASGEPLPAEWPVFGTTGYDFLNMVNLLFVDGEGVRALDEIYSRFIDSTVSFADIVYQKERQVIEELFSGEIGALGKYLAHLAHQHRSTRGLSTRELTRALAEVTACLPVYRTYLTASGPSPQDKVHLEHAIQEARRRNPFIKVEVLDFLRRVLYLDFPDWLSVLGREEWLRFVLKWQQLTGAIMAKGYEDTALYNYNRLISLNEVGGDPGSAGLSVAEFHNLNLVRLTQWPHTLNATSTHDTKRSEDVRARINVLSELVDEWEKHLERWAEWNHLKKQKVKGLFVPEPNMEIFLYQTLIGAWPMNEEEVPDFKERLRACLLKSAREAKVHTNWLSPDTDYESALMAFTDSVLEESDRNEFLKDFLAFKKQVAYYGAFTSLAQVLLKITSPGVPDFYQGTELWDFSLVDPDNRRPVDFARRVDYLNGIIQTEAWDNQVLIQQLLDSWEDGRVKLYVTYRALNFRKFWSEVFTDGQYIPLQVVDHRQGYCCAFARRRDEKWAVVVVPRLLTKLCSEATLPLGRKVWGDDRLLLPRDAPEFWLNIFTGESLNTSEGESELFLSDILSVFPVALLKGTDMGNQ